MQSTFSRTRHSSSFCAPDISLDSVAPLVRGAVLVDMGLPPCFAPSTAHSNQKGHRRGFLVPADGLSEFFLRSPSGGAGYGDLNNNGQQPRKYTDRKKNRQNRTR